MQHRKSMASLKPEWSEENIKWYMSKTSVQKINKVNTRSGNNNAPAGTIFEVDFKETKLDSREETEIVLRSCLKGTWRVRWAAKKFYGLDEEIKDLLLAITDKSDRLKIFEESQETLLYAKSLKKGDDVCVRLSKKKLNQVWGKVRYIGQVEKESTAKWFGVELVGKFGDTDGTFKKTGSAHFRCEQGRGIYVTVKSIVLPTPSQQERKSVSNNKDAHDSPKNIQDHRSTLGLDNLPQTSFIDIGDGVMVRTDHRDEKGHAVCYVGRIAFIHEDHAAVEVAESEGPVFCPWNGYYKGKKIYHQLTSQTQWAKLSDITHLYSPTDAEKIYYEEQRCESAYKPSPLTAEKESYAKITQKNIPKQTSHETFESRSSVSDVTAKCRDALEKNTKQLNEIWETSPAQGSQPHSLQGPLSMNSDTTSSDSRVSSSSSVERYRSNKKLSRTNSWDDSTGSSAAKHLKQQDGKGSKFNFKNYLPGFNRGATQPYPFSQYHTEVLSQDMKIMEILVKELRLLEKWTDICNDEKRHYFQVELLLTWWWSHHVHEGHKEELTKFTNILANHGRADLRDHIYKVPDHGFLHETVIATVCTSAVGKWRDLASALGLKQAEINENIRPSMRDEDCIQIVFRIWQAKEPGCRKLIELVKVCKKIGFDMLACDLEQGLSEVIFRKIADDIDNSHWEKFGQHLSITKIRSDAFREKFYRLSDRVFNMMCYWSMIQPLSVDKRDVLVHALESCKLEHLVEEQLSRGLREDDLQTTALIIGDQWQKAAAIILNPQDIHQLMDLNIEPTQKALQMLKLWRRRQPSDVRDLRETLYGKLMDCRFFKAARLLYEGLDASTITRLSQKLVFDWPLLARHFGYRFEEISERLKNNNQAAMSFTVLKEWLYENRNNNKIKTRSKLCEGLIAVGREDLAEWMQKRVEEDSEDLPPKAVMEVKPITGGTNEIKKLDVMHLEKIAIKVAQVDFYRFKDILNMSDENFKKFLPEKFKSQKKPHLAILCAWKRKQKHDGHGEKECVEQLANLLTLYDLQEAAAVLSSDGTSVDPEDHTSELHGAVGGSSVSDALHPDLNVSSMVEVTWNGKTRSGVIQWIGIIKGTEDYGKIAGVEVDDFLEIGGTDGTFSDVQYFRCQYGKGLFLPLIRVRPDSRFLTEIETFSTKERVTKEDFGGIVCEPIEGYVHPPNFVSPENIGLFKGIQGDHNSCYMDVTLYSMFAFNNVFDAILHYDESTTKEEVKDVKNALRETIVNPLRRNGIVRADYVLHFRDLLSRLSSMEGFKTEEKDPEEFIHALLQELLNAKPFLKICQGVKASMESFVYQIFMEKKDYLDVPTVGDLLHVSFLESDLKLEEVPDCFIIQLPRYGKKYKLYDWIIPSLEMDISLLIRKSPRPCIVCGSLAFQECRNCPPQPDSGIVQSFCNKCFEITHKRKQHQATPLSISSDFHSQYEKAAKGLEEDEIAFATEHLYKKKPMELFSVVCIETSHYVAFVKCGSGKQADWVFFDSMADRRGDQHGFNVPEVSHLREFTMYMEMEDLKTSLQKPDFPKHLKRLLSDAYICFYRPVKMELADEIVEGRESNVLKNLHLESSLGESQFDENQHYTKADVPQRSQFNSGTESSSRDRHRMKKQELHSQRNAVAHKHQPYKEPLPPPMDEAQCSPHSDVGLKLRSTQEVYVNYSSSSPSASNPKPSRGAPGIAVAVRFPSREGSSLGKKSETNIEEEMPVTYGQLRRPRDFPSLSTSCDSPNFSHSRNILHPSEDGVSQPLYNNVRDLQGTPDSIRSSEYEFVEDAKNIPSHNRPGGYQ